MVGRRIAPLCAAVLVALLVAAPVASAAVFKSGPLRYATGKLSYGAGSTGQVEAECPGASSIAAVGGSVASTSNSVGLSNLRVDEAGAPNSATSTGYNDGSEQTAQRTTAVCLARGGDAIEYWPATGTVPTSALSTSGQTACLNDGRLLAGTLETTGPIAAFQLEELSPVLSGRKVNRDSLAWGFSKATTLSPVDYQANAICLPPGAGRLSYRYRAEVAFGDEKTTIRTPCPKGTRAIGGGTGRFPSNLEASQPYDDGDKGKVPDDGWMSRTLSPSPDAIVTHAVCLG